MQNIFGSEEFRSFSEKIFLTFYVYANNSWTIFTTSTYNIFESCVNFMKNNASLLFDDELKSTMNAWESREIEYFRKYSTFILTYKIILYSIKNDTPCCKIRRTTKRIFFVEIFVEKTVLCEIEFL